MNRSSQSQRGVSLLVVLILLVVMSVLGIAVMRSSVMQERMAANLRDRSLTTQAVENALAFAMNSLETDPMNGVTNDPPETSTDCPISGSNIICGPLAQTPAVGSSAWINGPTLNGVRTEYWIQYLGRNQAFQESGGVVPNPGSQQTGPLFRITAQRHHNQPERAAVTRQTDVIYSMPRL
ncbi:PilX N-terminal domain-containing pilus assembly protein [Thermomonas sp.]|uniref:pilus assembly PilX family protein n=1 Tax=Thermomonas sp. TaxID=1971895 RepID=UPI00262F6071|nr:PilX N-terminal domain-containing pilus assembly protein [Thermomonas sp.]